MQITVGQKAHREAKVTREMVRSYAEFTFTSNATSPSEGDWGYIRFKDSSTDAIFNGNGVYQSGSILEYVTVAYGDGVFTHTSDNEDTGAVWADSASPFINNSIFEYNKKWGLFVDADDVFRVTNNTFRHNSPNSLGNLSGALRVLSGIVSNSKGTEIHISGNTFTSNGCTGSCMDWGASDALLIHLTTPGITTNVIDNTFTNNGAGQVLHFTMNRYQDSIYVVSGNEIIGNETSLAIQAGHVNGATMTISNNVVKANSNGGIWVKPLNGGRVELVNNQFINNLGKAIEAEYWAGSELVISGNTVSGGNAGSWHGVAISHT